MDNNFSIQDHIQNHGWVAIIAGGQGTRLFPLSHEGCPKQFCKINGNSRFIQLTAKRFIELGFLPQHIVVITTNPNQTRLANAQLNKMGVLSQNIKEISPNCGYPGAMIRANDFIGEMDVDSVIVNTPADQYIKTDDGKFEESMEIAIQNSLINPTIVGVKVYDLVTFTGTGHAKYENGEGTVHKVNEFVEKPNEELANKLMREDSTACNTGINVWTFKHFREATKMIDRNSLDTEGKNLDTNLFMLQFKNLDIAVGDFEWHDCGTLKALYDISWKTPHHMNASIGDVHRDECLRSLFICDLEGVSLYACGFEDYAVVVNYIDNNYVVVCVPLDKSQEVRDLAENYQKIVKRDFSIDAQNNTCVRTNLSDNVRTGFVCGDGITVHSLKVTEKKKVDGEEREVEHIYISVSKAKAAVAA